MQVLHRHLRHPCKMRHQQQRQHYPRKLVLLPHRSQKCRHVPLHLLLQPRQRQSALHLWSLITSQNDSNSQRQQPPIACWMKMMTFLRQQRSQSSSQQCRPQQPHPSTARCPPQRLRHLQISMRPSCELNGSRSLQSCAGPSAPPRSSWTTCPCWQRCCPAPLPACFSKPLGAGCLSHPLSSSR